jgi:hypothetical protein
MFWKSWDCMFGAACVTDAAEDVAAQIMQQTDFMKQLYLCGIPTVQY